MARLLYLSSGCKSGLARAKREGSLVCDCELYNFYYLNEMYGLHASSDSELLSRLIQKEGLRSLQEVDGVYALAFFSQGSIFLARDIVGLRPLWYSAKNGFAFASLKSDLEKAGCGDVRELEPRKILRYDTKKGKISFIERPFFSIKPEVKDSEDVIVEKISAILIDSVKRRIPRKRFGVLFSGGVDSTLIAWVCKKLGYDFTCYNAHFSYPGIQESQDFIYAKKVAKALGFRLKSVEVNLDKAEAVVRKLVPLIGPDAVKVGVALPEFFACELARKDGCGVVFSGLGSEELFAGYLRHKVSKDINKECLVGLSRMYERDAYRDYIVAFLNKVRIEAPFLDESLVAYSLRIPPKLKIKHGVEKFVMRQVAICRGVPREFALRKKKAAQYGSNSDKILAKLAKKNGFKYKADYLRSLSV